MIDFAPFKLTKETLVEKQRQAEELEERFDELPIPPGMTRETIDILFDMQREMYQLDLDGGFSEQMPLSDFLPETTVGDQTSVPPLPPQPMPNVSPNVIQTAQNGLTPTENALLTEGEKQIRLRQRGFSVMIDKSISYEDQRLTKKQKKKIKPANQGGGPNYLGKQETVTVPKKWLSDPDHVVAELAYITPREKKILIDLDLYGSLNGKPNTGPAGIPSLQGDMGGYGGTGGGGGNSGGGGDGMAGERAREARERAAQAAREAAQARAAASAREQAAERSRQEAAQRAAAQKAAAEKAAQQREQAREQQYSAPAPAPVAPTTTTTTPSTDPDNTREQYAVERTITPKEEEVSLDRDDEGNVVVEDPYVMVGGQKYAVDDPRIDELQDYVEEPSVDISPIITLGGLIMGGGIPSLYQGVSYLNNAGYLDFGPFNNREFFQSKVVPSGFTGGYDEYMKGRTSGELDAYGNKLSPQEDGNPLRDLLFAKQQQQQQNVNPLKQVLQQNPYDRFFKELNIIY